MENNKIIDITSLTNSIFAKEYNYNYDKNDNILLTNDIDFYDPEKNVFIKSINGVIKQIIFIVHRDNNDILLTKPELFFRLFKNIKICSQFNITTILYERTSTDLYIDNKFGKNSIIVNGNDIILTINNIGLEHSGIFSLFIECNKNMMMVENYFNIFDHIKLEIITTIISDNSAIDNDKISLAENIYSSFHKIESSLKEYVFTNNCFQVSNLPTNNLLLIVSSGLKIDSVTLTVNGNSITYTKHDLQIVLPWYHDLKTLNKRCFYIPIKMIPQDLKAKVIFRENKGGYILFSEICASPILFLHGSAIHKYNLDEKQKLDHKYIFDELADFIKENDSNYIDESDDIIVEI